MIEELLRTEYGITGVIERLGGTEETYKVSGPAATCIVKMSDAGPPEAVVALERAVIEVLQRALPDLELPRSRATRAGRPEVLFQQPDGRSVLVRVLDFVEGATWGASLPATPDRKRQLGSTLGTVARALSGFTHRSAARTHEWDLTRAGRHRDHVACVPDPGLRRMLEQSFLLHAAVVPMLAELPWSVIHGDANDENLIVRDGGLTGLVDFGDCLLNPTVCELAIALAYALLDDPRPLESGAEVVEAYHDVRALSRNELAVLFPLVCGRLSVTVARAAARRLVNPNHPTWFVTEPRAWRLLERLMALDPADAGTALASGTGIDPFDDRGAPASVVLERRQRHISPALSVAYREPLKILRGRGQYLHDERGRPFLDLVNNICHVGHCHPRVVEAGQRQMATLNTNTRYLSDLLVDYTERLCATLPPSLDTCFFVNSGSEANELALRLAITHTGRRDLLVVDSAYHGNTRALIAASPYKFMGRGGAGHPEPWVHVVPSPDGYRGLHRGQDTACGVEYGDEVARVLERDRIAPAAFLTESLLSCGGQIVPPPGFLATAFAHVRAAGGLCIADEVQSGFGRAGRAFWAFELQDVVPDVVVMGKPMGNGHPMAAVVTSRAVAASFETGMEFFSSFGGNPVSCAIGLAVLDVIRDERLQARAGQTGTVLLAGLRTLMAKHAIIGDVRGEGLFVGVELVRDRITLEPADVEAAALVNRLQARGILTSTDGPFHNVLKIKPPMVVTEEDVRMTLRVLDEELS